MSTETEPETPLVDDEPPPGPGPPLPAVRPRSALATADELTVDQLVAQRNLIRSVVEKVMEKDIHFGVIPGVHKPSLLKPGAEVLAITFRFGVDPEIEQHRSPDNHLDVTVRTTLWHIPTGNRVGSGVGSATTREAKYAFRQAARVCPECGGEFIIKGRREYGGGWICHKKRGGCAAKFDDASPEANDFEGADVSRKMRPPEELPDFWNTVLKMAAKRSLVAAILNATAASEMFTQDVEDSAPEVVREQRQETAGRSTPIPRSWAAVRELVVKNFGEVTHAEFAEFLSQACDMLYQTSDSASLAKEQRDVLFQKAQGAAVNLVEAMDGDFPPPGRRQMQNAFAAVLDGIELPGPEWAMSPEEAADRPARGADGSVDAEAEEIPFGDDAVDRSDSPAEAVEEEKP